jgi:hypothetical protein
VRHKGIYSDWIRVRRQAEVHPDFAGFVMDRIDRCESSRRGALSRWTRLIQRVSASSWAKAAAIALAAGLGFARILLTLHLLFLP